MSQIILFTDADFRGEHKHVFDRAGRLSLTVTDAAGQPVVLADGDFPNGVSSVAILSGNWQFFEEEDFTDAYPVVLGPGLYSFVQRYKIKNDRVRSCMAVDAEATMSGVALEAHMLLFEHANFRGDHRHVFGPVVDLGGLGFDDVTSSMVVAQGNWSLYRDSQFDGGFPDGPVFGPGIYPWVKSVGVENDAVSSLRPTASEPTQQNTVADEVLICSYAGFFGVHRHVFAPEPNLNAADDDRLNDQVSALAVLAGTWSFYSDAGFSALYNELPIGPGTYSNLSGLPIFDNDMSSLRPAIRDQTTVGQEVEGHVILFSDANFRGRHRHVFNAEPNLNADGDDDFNDSVSSLVVLGGNWAFFRNAGYDDDYPTVLGPGLYPWVGNVDIRNDDLSSLKLTEAAATVSADPPTAHVILFADAYFHGDHRHVFQAEPNLNADEDDSFNDRASSLAVVAGTWKTYADWKFGAPFPPILGPGLYPWVEAVGIGNDAVTSLEPEDARPTVTGSALIAHAILFEHANLRGNHKHVFVPEPNLNDSSDDAFNDATSSIAILLNRWFTYRDAQFGRPYDVTLGEGLFPRVEDVGIRNDDLSSLQVAGTRLQFKGVVTINVASGSLPDPVMDGISMSFLYDADTRQLQIENSFPPLPLNSVATMTFVGAQPGTFPADGQVVISDVEVALSAHGFSKHVTFTLATGTATSPTQRYQVTGSPADAAGNCVLVAAGQVSDDDFSIEIAGVFLPRPA